MRIPVFNKYGKRTNEILEFDEKIFGDEVREVLLKNIILMYEARQRVGTHSTKTRKECAGSGRKLWRQKGTGRARVGPARAPHWRGGGVVFGPKPRDYSYSLPKKARRRALESAWLAKFIDREVMVIEDFDIDNIPKTKKIYNTLKNMEVSGYKILIVANLDKEKTDILWKSSRNIPNITLQPLEKINAYLLLANRKIILLRSTFEKLIKDKGGEIKVLKREELYPKKEKKEKKSSEQESK